MKTLTSAEQETLFSTLRSRFEKNMPRHKGLKWDKVQARLQRHPQKLWSLNEMEKTGGEPDVVEIEESGDAVVFYDCAKQSPKGRRSLCYDQEALEARKQHKPKDSALNMATSMGITLLNEDQYRALQSFGEFDTTTSSWVQTPDAIRERGGALFCDRRYDHIFTYHNGAESYYAARGFRGLLKV